MSLELGSMDGQGISTEEISKTFSGSSPKILRASGRIPLFDYPQHPKSVQKSIQYHPGGLVTPCN